MNNHKIIKIKDNIHVVYKVFSLYESLAYWIEVKDNTTNDWRVLKPGEEVDGLAIEEYLLDYIVSTDIEKRIKDLP